LLKDLHAAGWVHRDVRRDNFLLRDDKGEIHVIDFGYATRTESSVSFAGTITYASDRVLNLLSNDNVAQFQFNAADDLESCVKCYWSWSQEHAWD